MNNRTVYNGPDGSLYALDTQHGTFEVVNLKTGKHKDEVKFYFTDSKSKPDSKRSHDLIVR